MKLILKDVKIYGYDKSICRTFNNDGKETKQYSVACYITDEDKAKIDTYLYNKVSTNQDGEHIFYGKSKQPIPIFTAEKEPILEPVNEVFIAEVSILMDEFEDKAKNEMVRYSKCLGIKYIKKIENEEPKIFIPIKEYNDFDSIFEDEEELTIPAIQVQQDAIVAPLQPDPMNVNAGNAGDDLPF